MGFNKTILIVAFVLLVIALVVIGLMINSAIGNAQFPPEVSVCPDWWKTDMSGNNVICNNTKSLGKKIGGTGICNILPNDVTGENGSMTNSKYRGLGTSAMKAKCHLATQCGITWDGITNTTNPDGGSRWC
jgi:hypothetical protein|tara:strand:- start:248 stop:640 length:393 start_codon:yes stop_codon:yes gene_type:complete